MATDKSQPRNGMIFMFTMLSVGALVVLTPIFNTYFALTMSARETKAVLETPTYRLDRLRQQEDRALSGGSMPIAQAMEAVARSRNASALIEPQPSNEGGAIQGWAQLPSFVSTANKNWTAPIDPPPTVPTPGDVAAPGTPPMAVVVPGPGMAVAAPVAPAAVAPPPPNSP